jgi:hypothetical protein
MSNGFGPVEATLTLPGLLWKEVEPRLRAVDDGPLSGPGAQESRPDDIVLLGREVIPADLVLRVVSEGWGGFAGFTVVDPESGEQVGVPYLNGVVIGTVEYDLERGKLHRYVFEYGALERFTWSKADRVRSAEQRLEEAERELAAARLRVEAERAA